MTGPQWIDQYDMQVRAHKGKIVIAPIPEYQLAFILGALHDGRVVDTRINNIATGQGLSAYVYN